ncbi:Hypothetical predicted protein [Paramuricea clavata]|uniref:AB hydrolase-1 domain-containing protein n=1 Tax=Paramuricea clavata TaxID=317549 RepID=A0A6S7H9J3_PARCT|nr:Hypothetical predicted protein [Paramuricea clavata]
MRRMNNGTKWTLFFIFIIAFGLTAFKMFESLSTKRRVKPNVYPKSHNYELILLRNEAPHIRTFTTKAIIKPTAVIVTKPPIPVIKPLKVSWKQGEIFYREIKPIKSSKLNVLLLHGREFTSANWTSLKTMDILAKHGYHVIAMDLPGSGKSTYKINDLQSDKKRAKVLENFIRKVGLLSPVIVSPSASGRYSLPYIASLRDPKAVSGFISIAVEGTDRILGKNMKHFPPTLILRGSRDTSLGVTSSNALKMYVPHTTEKVIKKAGRFCYINKPDEFHEILLNFLRDSVGQNIV